MPIDDEDGTSSSSSHESPSNKGLSKKRKRELEEAFALKGKKRKSALAIQPYTDFARWFTRSQQLYVDWFSVFQRGIAWDNKDFGKLTRQIFSRKYGHLLDIFLQMSDIPCFDDDFRYFEMDPDKIISLCKAMSIASGSARSDDISSLKYFSLVYTGKLEAGEKLDPYINPGDPKASTRGFNHPQLARLLCPMALIPDFDENPKEYIKKLANGSVKVQARDLPSFIWPKDGYDPQDITYEMFRNPVLIMVFKHIFTSPSSAMKELPGQTKTRACQAKKNKMTTVTPASIAYTCQQYRYAISSIEDWRNDDRLFKREDFYEQILRILVDAQDEVEEWFHDLIEWWNAQVLGTEPSSIDDSDNEEGPSTATILKKQREARKLQKQAEESGAQPTQAAEVPPPLFLREESIPNHRRPHFDNELSPVLPPESNRRRLSPQEGSISSRRPLHFDNASPPLPTPQPLMHPGPVHSQRQPDQQHFSPCGRDSQSLQRPTSFSSRRKQDRSHQDDHHQIHHHPSTSSSQQQSDGHLTKNHSHRHETENQPPRHLSHNRHPSGSLSSRSAQPTFKPSYVFGNRARSRSGSP